MPYTGCADVFLGSGIKVSAKPLQPWKDNIAEAASGSIFYSIGMAFAFVLLFSLPGYFYRFYKYVWQFYDDHTDYAVALWMYVYHSSRR